MTVRNPQLFNSAAVADLDKFIEDGNWALEQKVDGMRCLTVITRELYQHPRVEFFTRGGRELKSSAAKKHFDKLRSALIAWADSLVGHGTQRFEIVFDAEILTDGDGQLVILDMPYSNLTAFKAHAFDVTPETEYIRRRFRLLALAAVSELAMKVPMATIVTAATGVQDKIVLVNTVVEKNLEGFIAKRLDSRYTEGERVKHSLKIKLTQTADVVVMAKNSGESKHSIRGGDKINYEFGVWDTSADGHSYLKHIGNCSGIGKDNAEVGDVIEVEYLYAGAGGKLVQPRMIKIRTDKDQADCSIDQLKYVNKEVI
uniref:DNA ligase n=1 Tax=Micrococcus phage Kurnik TaxID=3092208 RepID=A0AAU6R748_9CAUD